MGNQIDEAMAAADAAFDKHAAELDAVLSPAKLTAEEWAEAVYVKSQLLESLSNRGRWLEQHGHDLAKFIREQERAHLALVAHVGRLEAELLATYETSNARYERAEAAEAERDAKGKTMTGYELLNAIKDGYIRDCNKHGLASDPVDYAEEQINRLSNIDLIVAIGEALAAAPPAADAKETGR